MHINRHTCLRHFRGILTRSISTSLLIIAAHSMQAADYTWDLTPGAVGAGDGAITGGAGAWNLANGNWTVDGGVNNVAWVNDPLNNAIFGGTGGTVTLGAILNLDSLTFNTPGYIISGTDTATPTNKLVFGGANSAITATANATLSARIEGTTLTKNGAGTLTYTSSSNLTNINLNEGLTIFLTGTGGFATEDAVGVNATVTVGAGATARLGVLGTTSTSGVGVNNFKVNTQFVINGGTVDVQERSDIGRITMTGGTITGQTGVNDSLGRLWIRDQGFVINPSATTATISTNNLALAANTTFDVADGAAATDLLVSSRIMQAFGFAKIGAGSMTLAGANSYTGATNLNAGLTTLAGTGALANTAVTVANGATFRVLPGATMGTTATAAAGASLNLAAGSIFEMADGTASTLNVLQGATFAPSAFITNGATFNFDLTNAGADKIVFSKTGSFQGVNTLDVITSSGGFLVNGAYDLISTTGLSGAGSFSFPGGLTTKGVTIGTTNYTLSLATTATAQQVVVSGGFDALTTAYWKGGTSSAWNASFPSNWATDAGGTEASIYPTSGTDVIFSVKGGGTDLNTTLGQNTSIRSLTFETTADDAHAVTIGGANSLTVGAGGITVVAGSGAHTISTSAVILGAAQVWTNDSANPLKITAPISGGNVDLNGAGTFTLTGANTYGTTTIAAATSLRIGDGTTGGTLGTGAVTNNGTLTFNRADNFTVGNQINGSGKIVKTGAGTLTYTGGSGANASTTTTDLTVEQGRMIFMTGFDVRDAMSVNGVLTVKAGAVAQIGDGTTAAGVNNFSFDREFNIDGGTVDVRDRTDIGRITMTGGTLTGTSGIGNSGKLFIRTPGFVINASAITSVVSTGHLAPANDGGPQFLTPPVFNVADGAAEPDLLVSSAIRQNSAGLGIIKNGPGKMVVTSLQNNLTGTTTIAEGTLEIGPGSTLGGTENVIGGTLSGVGTAGIVNLSLGGSLAPGQSGIGTLTTSALSFADTSILTIDIGATTSDSVDVNGLVTLSGTSSLSISLVSDPVDGTVFTLLNSTGGIAGFDLGGHFSYDSIALGEGQIFTVSDGLLSQAFSIHYADDAGRDVTLTAVPEPGTATLLLGGLALLARRRRGAVRGSTSL